MKNFGIYSDFLSVEEKLHRFLQNHSPNQLPSIAPLIEEFASSSSSSVSSEPIAPRTYRKVCGEPLLGLTLQMIDYCQKEFRKKNAHLTQNNIAFIFKIPASTLASRLQNMRRSQYITGPMTITETGRIFMETFPAINNPPIITDELIRDLPRQASSINLLFGTTRPTKEVARPKKHKAP